MAEKKVSTTLEQDKVCKSCIRFRGSSDDKVTTSLYLQKESYDKLGSPKKIQVSVTTK
jgi:hypothetical protein